MEKQTSTELRRASGAKTVLTLVLGLALGFAASDFNASERSSRDVGAQEGALNVSVNEQAAPSVSLDASGRARFSRPLEVPPLYAFDSPLVGDETGRQLVLVDAETKRICVYWIRQRGVNSTIELVATRAYELDLKLDDFNGEGLAPSQIREQLESTLH